MQEPVGGGAGKEFVLEERRPFLDRAIRGDDQGAALVALADDFVEVERFVVLQRAQAEVVDDEQIGCGEAEQAPIVDLIVTVRRTAS
nr:hypothetical protein [Nannocystis sp. SCPEA4]